MLKRYDYNGKLRLPVLLPDDKVRFFPYRSGKLNLVIAAVDVPDNEGNLGRYIDELCQMAGCSLDNHVVWEVTRPDGSSYAVQWTDRRLLFGVGVTEGYW